MMLAFRSASVLMSVLCASEASKSYNDRARSLCIKLIDLWHATTVRASRIALTQAIMSIAKVVGMPRGPKYVQPHTFSWLLSYWVTNACFASNLECTL